MADQTIPAIQNLRGNIGIGTASPSYKLEVDGGDFLVNTNNGGYVQVDESDNSLKLSDNIKLKAGTGNDLSFYHNSSNNISFIENSHANGLRIKSDELLIFAHNGSTLRASFDTAVKLLYNDAYKFETTAAGVKVTGNLDILHSQTQSGSIATATIKSTATTTATSTQSSAMYAIQNNLTLAGTGGSFQNSLHQQVMTTVSSTGTATNLKNHLSRVHTSGSGQINNVAHYNTHTELSGNGTITNWIGYSVAHGSLTAFENTGHTITNTYGLYIGDITSGTQTNTPFGVYQLNTDMRNYFGGSVGIGTASPNALLHVKSTGNGEIEVERASGALINLQAQSARGVIGTDSNHELQLKTNGGARLTLSTSGLVTFAGTGGGALTIGSHIDLGDDQKVRFGATDQLQIYHNGGTNGFIHNTTPYLVLESGSIIFRNTAGDEDYAKFIGNSGCELYYNNSKKFETTNDGVTVNGKIKLSQASSEFIVSDGSIRIDIDNNNNETNRIFVVSKHNAATELMRVQEDGNVGIGTSAPAQKLHIKGDRLRIEESVNARHLDIIPAVSGSSHIFTSSTTGSGYTFQNSSGTIAILDANGSAFYQDLTIASSNLKLSSAHYVQFGSANARIQGSNGSNYLKFYTGGVERLAIGNLASTFSGNVIISGGLTVQGTTTTIDSTTVSVDDKNIELGSVATPTDLTADGGGITLKGASDYTINWSNSTDSWHFNQGIVVGEDGTGYDVVFYGDTSDRYLTWDQSADKLHLRDNVKATFGNSDDLQIFHNGSNSYIRDNGDGGLILEGSTLLELKARSGEVYFRGTENGAVNLYHNNALKLSTTSTGATITGRLSASELAVTNIVTNKVVKFNGTTLDDSIITDDGDVGINATAPARKLEVIESSSSIVAQFKSTSGTSSYITLANNTSTADKIRFGSIGNDLVLSTNYLERLRILSNGKVGIDNTNPQHKLDVDGTIRSTHDIVSSQNYTAFTVGSDRTIDDYGGLSKDYWKVVLRTNGSSTTGEGGNHHFGDLVWSAVDGNDTNFHERFVMRANGNVGIGVSVPSKKLHIDGDIKVKNSGKLFLWNDNDNNYLDYQNWIASTGNAQLIRNTGSGGIKLKSTSLEVVVTSGVGIGTTTPSRTLHVVDSAGPTIKFERGTASNLEFTFGSTNASIASAGEIQFRANGGTTNKFIINNSQIQSNAKLLVATTGIGFEISTAGTSGGAVMRLKSTGETSAGNSVGKIEFFNSDTTDHTAGVMAQIRAVAGPSGGEGHLQFLTDMPSSGADANQVALHLHSNANVGIGTTAPNRNLSIVGQIGIDNSASSPSAGMLIAPDGTSNKIYSRTANNVASAHPLDFYAGSAHTLRIASNGNVGIGTTAPSQKLEIIANATSLANQPAEPLFVHNDGNNIDGRVFLSVKHDRISTAQALGAGLKMTAGAVTAGTASYFDSLILLEGAAAGSDTIHSAPKAIKFYVDNHDTAAGDGNDYNQLGDLALTIKEDKNISATGVVLFNDNKGINFGNSNAKIYGSSSDGIKFNAGNVEAMRLNQAGNVGIGTTGPTSKLQISTPAIGLDGMAITTLTTTLATTAIGAKLSFTGGSNTNNNILGGVSMGNAGEEFAGMYAMDGGSGGATHLGLFAGTSSAITEGIRILSNGAVGIGSTSVNSGIKLQVAGGIYPTVGYVYAKFFRADYFSSGQNAEIQSGGSGKVQLRTSNNVQLEANSGGFVKLSHVGSTSGGKFLVRTYSGDDYLNVFSTEHSSGSLCLGYGAAGKYNASGFVSTYDNFAGHKTLLKINHNGFNVLTTSTNQTDTVGADLMMTNRFTVQNDKAYFGTGNVGIGTTSPVVKLDVHGDFMVTNTTPRLILKESGSSKDISLKVQTNGRLDILNDNQVNTLATVLQDGKVGIGTTSPAAPLSLVGVNGGSWNDGLIIDDPSGWAATVYKRNNSPKMFTGLYSGNDNYIWMSTGYSNSGTTITAPRADAVLMARPSTDDLQIYLETHFGNKVGIGTTSPAEVLDVVGLIKFGHTRTNNAQKIARLLVPEYNNSHGSFLAFMGTANQTSNAVSYGGGTSSADAATVLLFYTASAVNTTVGTERMRIESDGDVGIGTQSPQQKLDVDGVIKQKVYTVANLPSASSSTIGARAFVSDSYYPFSSSYLGSQISGSGSNFSPVYSDGSYWYMG